MADREDWVNSTALTTLNDKIAKRGHIDREDILSMLRLIDTTDAQVIVAEIKAWLQAMHNDPRFKKFAMPDADIDAVLGDLDAYGVVQSITILQLKEASNRNLL